MSRAKPRHLNPNKCRSGDVDRSHEAAVLVRSAADLTDEHVRLLIETAVRQGREPADYCWGFWRFDPDEAGRALIAKVVRRLAPELLRHAWIMLGWRPWLGEPMPEGKPVEWWPEGERAG